MSEASRISRPKPDELPSDLSDLITAAAELSGEGRATIAAQLERVVEGTRRRRRILGLVQEALGQLRLDMKYLMFDLEATKRERDDYRAKLEEQEEA